MQPNAETSSTNTFSFGHLDNFLKLNRCTFANIYFLAKWSQNFKNYEDITQFLGLLQT